MLPGRTCRSGAQVRPRVAHRGGKLHELKDLVAKFKGLLVEKESPPGPQRSTRTPIRARALLALTSLQANREAFTKIVKNIVVKVETLFVNECGSKIISLSDTTLRKYDLGVPHAW